jgi:uroporphyrinogen-III synthase
MRRAILVTRPEPGAADTAGRLAAAGFAPVVAPMLIVERLAPSLPDAGTIQAVIAASANAVSALPTAFHARPLLGVGDATAARARDAGFADVTSAGGDATALAALAAQRCDPRGAPLLLSAGRGQGHALAAMLRGRGFRVIRRATYAARPVPALPASARDALEGGSLAAAMFFSAETARHFVRLVIAAGLTRRVGDIEALAIGAAAVVALDRLPWRRVRVARHPTQDEIFALLR